MAWFIFPSIFLKNVKRLDEGSEMESSMDAFLTEKNSSVAQIIKYVISGGISVAVVQVSFYLLAWLVLPCMRATDPVARMLITLGFSVRAASEDELKRNLWIIMIVCFLLSNAVAYLLNVLFVFKTGRHRKSLEILLFFGSSLLQFFFIWIAGILISVFKWEVTYANFTMLLSGFVANYLIRKHVVFSG